MKNLFLLFALLCIKQNFVTAQQSIKIVPSEQLTVIAPYEKKPGINSTTTRDITIKLEYWGTIPSNDMAVPLSIVNLSSGAVAVNPVITTIGDFSIPKDSFKSKHDTVAFKLHITINATPISTIPEFFDIQITGHATTEPVQRVIIQANNNKPDLQKSADAVTLQSGSFYITPFYDTLKNPQSDTIKLGIHIPSLPYNAAKSKLQFEIHENSDKIPNHPILVSNEYYTINKTEWEGAKGLLTVPLVLNSVAVDKKDRNMKPFSFDITLKDQNDSKAKVWVNNSGIPHSPEPSEGPKMSNFFVGSFIKSISGTTAQSELLDILMKVNLSSAKRISEGKYPWFAFIGADAGLSSDTSKKTLPINEAVANINMGITPINADVKRIGFIGGGLKVFYQNAYFGAHFGITELTGWFRESYLLVGFYNSPWIPKVTDFVNNNTLVTPTHNYRNNIYFESAFNAFGDNVPKALQSIRLKFGLMLPIAVNDNLIPTNKDFIYRLAVEVPIGGPIKF